MSEPVDTETDDTGTMFGGEREWNRFGDNSANEKPAGRLGLIRYRCKQEGLPCTLTTSHYAELLYEGRCHFCLSSTAGRGSGVARLEKPLGYIPGNVVPSCRGCNLKLRHTDAASYFEATKQLREVKRDRRSLIASRLQKA